MAYRNANDTVGSSRPKKSRSGSSSRSARKGKRKKKASRSTRAAGGTKRKKSSGSSRKKSARTYARYDPDTYILARVANTDPRYDEWLTAAQMRSAKKQREKEREKRVEAGLKVAQGVAPAVVPAAARTVAAAQNAATAARKSVARLAATRVAVGAGSAATVSISAAAGLAILAGVASYYGTTWIMDRIRKLTDPQEKAYELATAYRNARREAAAKLGRPLTPEEVKYLGAELNAQLTRMGIRT